MRCPKTFAKFRYYVYDNTLIATNAREYTQTVMSGKFNQIAQ